MIVRYLNKSGRSGVYSYDIQKYSITVNFINGASYLYSNVRPGTLHLHKMISLARNGLGLNTYIVTVIGNSFLKRLK